jgi:hypothetical protein
MKYIFTALLVFAISCTTDTKQTATIEERYFSDSNPFVNADSHSQIGQPAYIHATEEGVLVYDYLAQTVFNFDDTGIEQSQFGREGDGPGEFRYIAEIWDFEDRYTIYDRNGGKLIHFSKEGALLSENVLDMDSFTLTMTAISPHELYVPTNGENGTLLRYIDRENGVKESFGTAISQSTDEFDFDRSQQSIAAGNIPPNMINRVLLSSNSTGVFVFQQATAILQKYNHSRELEWEVDLNISATEGIFDRFLEINQSFIERGMRNMYMLQFASQLKSADDGVFVLLNTVEDKPVTVVWASNDGKLIIAAYDDNSQDVRPDLLTTSLDGSIIYLGTRMDGEIRKLTWPD